MCLSMQQVSLAVAYCAELWLTAECMCGQLQHAAISHCYQGEYLMHAGSFDLPITERAAFAVASPVPTSSSAAEPAYPLTDHKRHPSRFAPELAQQLLESAPSTSAASNCIDSAHASRSFIAEPAAQNSLHTIANGQQNISIDTQAGLSLPQPTVPSSQAAPSSLQQSHGVSQTAARPQPDKPESNAAAATQDAASAQAMQRLSLRKRLDSTQSTLRGGRSAVGWQPMQAAADSPEKQELGRRESCLSLHQGTQDNPAIAAFICLAAFTIHSFMHACSLAINC